MGNDTRGTAGEILRAAVKGLQEWENEEVSLDDYLDTVSTALRAPVSSLLFEYFRNKMLIDGAVSTNATRIPRGRYRRIIAVVLTQAFFQSGIRAESAVNVAVQFVRDKYGKSASGFVNAVLRGALKKDINDYRKIYENDPLSTLPEEIKKRWQKRFDAGEIRGILCTLQEKPEFTFRVTGDLSEAELSSIGAVPVEGLDWTNGLHFYRLEEPRKLFQQPWLKAGNVYVQDPSTSLAPLMADVRSGDKVLDLCAAPGGKSLIMAECLAGTGELVAADRSARRQEMTRQNFLARGYSYKVLSAPAQKLNLEQEHFDVVLADVPCSNTGVFRKRADALWRFSNKRLEEILDLQRSIINAAVSYVKPGGRFIFSTCSIEPEEDSQQVQWILKNFPNMEFVKDRLLLPSEHCDGAYAALLRKKT
jgi:16S rRNA (cytosine967-C5)-methyltransferase